MIQFDEYFSIGLKPPTRYNANHGQSASSAARICLGGHCQAKQLAQLASLPHHWWLEKKWEESWHVGQHANHQWETEETGHQEIEGGRPSQMKTAAFFLIHRLWGLDSNVDAKPPSTTLLTCSNQWCKFLEPRSLPLQCYFMCMSLCISTHCLALGASMVWQMTLFSALPTLILRCYFDFGFTVPSLNSA